MLSHCPRLHSIDNERDFGSKVVMPLERVKLDAGLQRISREQESIANRARLKKQV